MAFSPETYGAVKTLIEETMVGAGAIKGQDGAPGKDGKSAYEVAKDNGFEGTEEEWLSSLVGNAVSNAEAVSYENESHPDLTNVDSALNKIFAKIYYVAPSIISFTMTPSTDTYEIGTTIPTGSLAFSWTVNKDIISQSLTDCTISVNDRSATYNKVLSSTKTFTLTISDGENTATASKKINFLNKIYWGSAAIPTEYNSAFVLGLSKNKFASSKNGTYDMTIESSEYGYLAAPASFGTISSCWIGGFETTLDTVATINFTNASGKTSSYTIYKTGKAGLGSISMQIK